MEKQQTAPRRRVLTEVRWPKLYHVIFHNDDITTMDFVVMVLKVVFFKNDKDAESLMMTVHKRGKACVGTYPQDIALSKRDKATHMAKEAGFPLHITCEEE